MIPTIDILVLIQKTFFIDLWRKNINKLFKKGIFIIIIEKDILQGVYIFNLYFINKIKYPNIDKAFKKLRLVIQAYNN